HQPVQQRRLVEVAYAVDAQRDPVALRRHRLRDRGVEAFRRIEKWGTAEAGQEEPESDDDDAERDAPHYLLTRRARRNRPATAGAARRARAGGTLRRAIRGSP